VKEVPTVLNHTLDVTAAAPQGAVFTGVRSPWASLSAVGANYVRTQNPVQAAGCPATRVVAFEPVPGTMTGLTGMTAQLPTVDNRKQTVHKTRINAGGYGAMGPHPEREPA
jgi:hypothetical protein